MVHRKRVERERQLTMRLHLPALVLGCWALAVRSAATEPASNGWRQEFKDSQPAAPLTLALRARQDVKGWLSSSRPILTIRCSDGKVAVYVETGLALEVTQVDQQIVRMRFDDLELHSERWREVGNWTMSARHPVQLIEQLLRSRSFMLEFTPFGSAPTQADFAVSGLREYSGPLATSCGVHESARSAPGKDAE